jgi:hypothetical protein
MAAVLLIHTWFHHRDNNASYSVWEPQSSRKESGMKSNRGEDVRGMNFIFLILLGSR